MKINKYPLRYSIPIGILVFNLVLLAFDFQSDKQAYYNQEIENSSINLKETGLLLSMDVESSLRNNNLAKARDILNQISVFKNISQVFLIDEKQNILIADNFRLEGKNLRQIVDSANFAFSGLNAIDFETDIIYDDARNLIINSNEIFIGTAEGNRLPDQKGLLIIVKDLTKEFKSIQNEILSKAWLNIIIYLIFSFILWLIFDRVILRRINSIINGFQNTELLNTDLFKGKDELSMLAIKFYDLHNRLTETLTRYQTILNTSNVAIAEVNTNGEYIYVNKAWEKIFGYTKEEAIGKPTSMIIHPDEKDISLFEKTKQGEITEFTQTRKYKTKSGEIKFCELYVGANLNNDKIESIVGVMFDISKKIKAEKERDQIFENSVDMICTASMDGYFMQLNPAWEKTLGWNRDELRSKPFIDFTHPDDVKSTLKAAESLSKGKSATHFENRYKAKNGDYKWLSWNSISIPEENIILGVARDVTEIKNTEYELKHHTEFIKTLTDNQPAGVVACDANGELVLFNKTAKQWHGIDILKAPKSEWAKHYGLYDSTGESMLETDKIPLIRAFNGEKVVNTEIIIKAKEQKDRIVLCNGASFYDEQGKELGAVIVMNDITQSKKYENELVTKEARLKSALEEVERSRNLLTEAGKLAKVGGWELDLISMDTYFTGETFKIYDIPPEKPPKVEEGITFYAPEAREFVEKTVAEAINNKKPYDIEVPFISGTGQKKWVRTIGQIQMKDHKPVRLYGAIQDITIQKEAEEMIRLNEFIMTASQKIAKVGGWQWDVMEDKMYWTDETYQIHDFEKGQFEMGSEEHIKKSLECYEDKDREKIALAFNKCVERGEGYEFIVPFTTAKGRKLWIQTSAEPIVENGKVRKVTGVIQDITQRKQIEKNLQQSEFKYKKQANFLNTIIKNSPFAMWISDANGWLIRVNQVLRDTLEIPADMDITKYNILNDENFKKQGLTYILDDAFKNHKGSRFEMFWLGQETGKDNLSIPKKLWVFGSMFPIVDEKGELINVIFQYVDITERKEAEEELKNSEQRFRTIVEGAPDPIFIQINNCFAYLNNHAVKLFGAKDEKELIGKPVLNRFHPDYHKKVKERIKALNNDKMKVNEPFEYIVKQLNGNEIWVETKGQPIFYDGEHGGLVFVRDVTKRKRTEERMNEYQQSLKQLTTELSLAEEKQRKEIASNIHDHLSQSLVISKMKLNDLLKAERLKPFETELGLIKNYISEALENSRNITYDLSPPVLYELGLIETMYWLADKMEEENKLKIEIFSEFETLDFPEPSLILLYRSIQEVLYNTIKHANANKVTIHFKLVNEKLEIMIQDDGHGFDAGKLDEKREKNRFGLFTVKERIQNLGGIFSIESRKKSGTKVKFSLPFANKSNNDEY